MLLTAALRLKIPFISVGGKKKEEEKTNKEKFAAFTFS